MKSQSKSEPSPILNGPYTEPEFHYATADDGSLDYERPVPGRRIFAPNTPQVPLGRKPQGSLYDLNDFAGEYRDKLVNLIREQVSDWRAKGYPLVASRVTCDLLDFWFRNEERPDHKKLFFAQREAVETAIWLNEVAHKSNAGAHVLGQLKLANESVEDAASVLPRIGFKMATGTGKTVVMACLLLYHYLNRSEYRNDPRYADYFLIVAPGVTIRDRLSVLRVDTQAERDADASDYYRQRQLVPPRYQSLLSGLNAKLVITNFHAFEPRQLSGNKRSPLDGKRGADGQKAVALESVHEVIRRVMPAFKPGRRMVVLKDQAQSAANKERTTVWASAPKHWSGYPWFILEITDIDRIKTSLTEVTIGFAADFVTATSQRVDQGATMLDVAKLLSQFPDDFPQSQRSDPPPQQRDDWYEAD